MILKIEGRPLLDQFDLMRYVGTFAPDTIVHMTVWRPREATS